MPVIDVITDPEALTFTMVSEFDAPVERLWRAFTDPRQLERFWGPPTWPSRFTQFELRPGGRAAYRMTGPDGESSAGLWEFVRIDAPRFLEVIDSFADDDGNPDPAMPSMRMTYEFTAVGDGSRLTSTTYFPDHDALERLSAMGMVEGSTLATNQLDVVLHELREWSAGRHAQLERLGDTTARVTRVLNGPAPAVWRAHTEPDLMRRWMLGPDGWEMTSCAIDLRPGGDYHYAWARTDGSDAFGFEGQVCLVEPERRLVTTERPAGTSGPGAVNDLSLYDEDGLTLLTLVMTFPDEAACEEALRTGMVDGMEASYARLEGLGELSTR